MNVDLWEILVPTAMGDTDKPVSLAHHKHWDNYVRNLSNGLTILKPAKGQWIFEDKLYEERMIPVRICCTKADIEDIIDFTIGHYRQKAVMAYKLSSEVIIKHVNK